MDMLPVEPRLSQLIVSRPPEIETQCRIAKKPRGRIGVTGEVLDKLWTDDVAAWSDAVSHRGDQVGRPGAVRPH